MYKDVAHKHNCDSIERPTKLFFLSLHWSKIRFQRQRKVKILPIVRVLVGATKVVSTTLVGLVVVVVVVVVPIGR